MLVMVVDGKGGGIGVSLIEKILEEQDMDILSKYLKLAAHAESVQEFADKAKNIINR